MSKFVVTGLLLLLLAVFLHYTPANQRERLRSDVPAKTRSEIVIFPINEQIKIARLEKHMSQKELADRVGLTTLNIERIEKGQVVPTRDVLLKMEQQLDAVLTLDGY